MPFFFILISDILYYSTSLFLIFSRYHRMQRRENRFVQKKYVLKNSNFPVKNVKYFIVYVIFFQQKCVRRRLFVNYSSDEDNDQPSGSKEEKVCNCVSLFFISSFLQIHFFSESR